MPLYVSQDEEKFVRIEDYVNKFPEISLVRYYSAEGEAIFADYPHETGSEVAPIDPRILQAVAQSPAKDKRYLLDTLFQEVPLVRITKPIWTESLLSDGLLGFDPYGDQEVKETLIGYVELGLDFSHYQAQLTQNLVMGSLLSVGILILLTIASWSVYRRALLPLSQLQQPLRNLADGQTNFRVRTTGHKEIVAIANALNTTVSALNERDKKLRQLANHDPLTGLYNRHRLSELLDQELDYVASNGTTSALLFIDLDQFKYVNDTVGHAAGDRLLKDAADRLKASVRANDVVCRFGGDEFVVLLSEVKKKNVEKRCEAMLKIMREHRFLDGGASFSIPCSIGVTMITSDQFTPNDLLAQADMACHHAKTRGRNQYHFYKASGKETREMEAEVNWSQQIQKALADGSFVLHYQPIVDVHTGKPTHYEVLLRMKLENKKLIPPNAFLPAANRFGLMTEIDEWVIANALKRLAEFRTERGDLRFTLNVSGHTFETTDLFEYIQEHLKRNELPLDAIVLEITEQVAVRNMGNAGKQISDLAKLGVKFAIDDFGAGYSSYSYLKTLPVDYIKIDGVFISNLADDIVDQKIVSSISQIAQATNKKTIAEHVGDYRTFELLRVLGVDYAQGFFIGRPSAKLSRDSLPTSITAVRRRRAG